MEIRSVNIECLPIDRLHFEWQVTLQRRFSCGLGPSIGFGLLWAAVILVSCGCRRASEMEVHPVSGTVTIDGKPLAEGWITFRSVNGDTRRFAAPIANGKYRAEAFAGPARVEVTASREVLGEFVSGGLGTEDIPKREQFIPSRYNEKTELTAEIPVGGQRDLDFVLTL